MLAAAFLAERVLPAYWHAGHRVQVVLTDQGVEWRGAFDAVCRTAALEHRRPKPRHA